MRDGGVDDAISNGLSIPSAASDPQDGAVVRLPHHGSTFDFYQVR